jgi:carbon monoxide dehydrogenase subunit G
MEINGERLIEASQQRVWEAINDPQMLKLCIPGCESVERIDATQMKAVVAARIGPVRARFSGKVSMADVVAPESCTLHFEGTGGPAGFAKGQATVHLAVRSADTTLLTFSAAASVGGKLGQIGGRLIESAARSISDEFFDRMMAQLAPAPESVPAPSPGLAPAPEPAQGGYAAPAPARQALRAEAPVPVREVAAQGELPLTQWLNSRWTWALGCLVIGYIARGLF